MEPTPLRPVVDPSVAPTATRSESRPRPQRSLPTDRMKHDMQHDALLALARLSYGTRAVDAGALAVAIGVSPATAPLSNGFFRDSGWIEKHGKGKWVATPALVEYYNRLGSNMPDARDALVTTAVKAWYWEVLGPVLTGNNHITRDEAQYHLRSAAGATPEHKPQINNLLEWLQFIGLISINDDTITRVKNATVTPSTLVTTSTPERDAPGGTGAQVQESTTQAPAQSGAPMLAFSFDVKLTRADLATFSPEQIKALFEAVGTIASVTNARP